MKKTKFLGLLLLMLVSLNFVAFKPAHAQTAGDQVKSGFSISPPSFDIKANAGDKLTNTIKVENTSTQPITLTAKVQNFVAYGNEGQIQLTTVDSVYSISTWITFVNEEITVEPGEVKLFSYIVTVPANAQPGSHFGSIVLSTSASSSAANSASVIQEIGSVVLIKLPGDVLESAKVKSFGTASSYYTEPTVTLNALLNNTGSVIVQPVGKITVSDLFGNTVQTIDITGKNILPGSDRIFDQKFDFEKVGFFKAKLELTYGSSKTLTAETSFMTLYTSRTLPILIGLLLLIALYVIFRKRINKAIRVVVKG
ncbi:MAG: DUF916 domain-containing protein [Candidatus Dojkabacteria bacterium]